MLIHPPVAPFVVLTLVIQNLADELVSLGLAIIPYLTIHPLVLAALTWLLGVVALGTGDLPKRGSADRREGRET